MGLKLQGYLKSKYKAVLNAYTNLVQVQSIEKFNHSKSY